MFKIIINTNISSSSSKCILKEEILTNLNNNNNNWESLITLSKEIKLIPKHNNNSIKINNKKYLNKITNPKLLKIIKRKLALVIKLVLSSKILSKKSRIPFLYQKRATKLTLLQINKLNQVQTKAIIHKIHPINNKIILKDLVLLMEVIIIAKI